MWGTIQYWLHSICILVYSTAVYEYLCGGLYNTGCIVYAYLYTVLVVYAYLCGGLMSCTVLVHQDHPYVLGPRVINHQQLELHALSEHFWMYDPKLVVSAQI